MGRTTEGLLDLNIFIIVTIIFAALVVYFLRGIYFLRTRGVDFWNEETSPHYQGKKRDGGVRVNKPLSKSKNHFIKWTILSVVGWLTFICFFWSVLLSISVLNLSIEGAEWLPVDLIKEVTSQLPIIGDLIGFELFPGDTMFGTVSYLVGAMPLTIAIRNLLFVLENVNDYSHTEDETMIENLALVMVLTILGDIAILLPFSILSLIYEFHGV